MIKNIFYKTIMLLLFIGCIFGCTTNEEAVVVNEAEFITSVTLIFTPDFGGDKVILEFKDLDGDGANAPFVTANRSFETNKTYNGEIFFRNELANPSINITPEIVAEALEHQMFYQTTGNLNPLTYATTKSNFDSKGKPLGLQTIFKTTSIASGVLRVILRHGPNKSAPNVANGDITNAGGATDIAVDFTITVK